MIKQFLWNFRRFMGFIRIIFNKIFWPRIWLPGHGGRPWSRAGRPIGRPTCTRLCTFVWQWAGRPDQRAVLSVSGRSTGFLQWSKNRSLAVDRPVDRQPVRLNFQP